LRARWCRSGRGGGHGAKVVVHGCGRDGMVWHPHHGGEGDGAESTRVKRIDVDGGDTG
jgi:hypothetical protein